jgi:hypothetical protein
MNNLDKLPEKDEERSFLEEHPNGIISRGRNVHGSFCPSGQSIYANERSRQNSTQLMGVATLGIYRDSQKKRRVKILFYEREFPVKGSFEGVCWQFL